MAIYLRALEEGAFHHREQLEQPILSALLALGVVKEVLLPRMELALVEVHLLHHRPVEKVSARDEKRVIEGVECVAVE